MKSNVIMFPSENRRRSNFNLEQEMQIAKTTKELNELAEGENLIYEALKIPEDILEKIKIKPIEKNAGYSLHAGFRDSLLTNSGSDDPRIYLAE